jgi:peptidoglycan/xylan/chitin deacetylase (PgdA/CDA1 family)
MSSLRYRPLAGRWLPHDAWPDGFRDTVAFNAASRAELRTLATVLADTAPAEERQQRWLVQEKARVTDAYGTASGAPIAWDALTASARETRDDGRHSVFWTTWVAGQLRLARLFPKMTSEVFPLVASDVMGNALPDLTFSLTFDDGPTRHAGATDRTIDMLRDLDLPATFFIQGERFARRKDARTLYAGFGVASHGKRHVPHIATDPSLRSVALTREQLEGAVDDARTDLFRPPFGQRGDDFAQQLDRSGVRTVLWNIDSQDWRILAQAAKVAGRVLALMLVRRRGVILFHDTVPIAQKAVPLIRRALGGVPVRWAGSEAW